MLSRIDVGAFPNSRWKGVTIMPWASEGLALRAVLQKEGKVVPSLLLNGLCL